ncbi:MAG: hypothetical protein DI630_13440 [Gordonia sp. (in: high G+C Gram-positive bacteria)]|nr:MAG: hypothetical protein DI630_13440 [Gordonia sp. (in: high G+C Gram-positive bacteria)]
MPQNAQSVFARQQPKPRMRQQRNNSVASAPDTPANGPDTTDESLLSLVPDDAEPTFDSFVTDEEEPTFDSFVPDAPVTAPQGEQESTADADQVAPTEGPAKEKPAPAAKAPAETKPPKSAEDDKAAKSAPSDVAEEPETATPAPEVTEDPVVAVEPAQDEPEPAPVPAPVKKATKAPASKSRAATPAAEPAHRTALAVINPDGSVTVDPGTHLVDLREVAAQDDPHALVDMLGALRGVSDSELRQRVAAEISAAITTAALRT